MRLHVGPTIPQLHYKGGRNDRSRSCGLLSPRQALYQLSYISMVPVTGSTLQSLSGASLSNWYVYLPPHRQKFVEGASPQVLRLATLRNPRSK